MYPPKTSSQQMIIVWWFYRPFIIDRIRLFIPIINVQQDLKNILNLTTLQLYQLKVLKTRTNAKPNIYHQLNIIIRT